MGLSKAISDQHLRINLVLMDKHGDEEGYSVQVDIKGRETVLTHVLLDLAFEEDGSGPWRSILIHMLYHILRDKDNVEMRELLAEAMSHEADEDEPEKLVN